MRDIHRGYFIFKNPLFKTTPQFLYAFMFSKIKWKILKENWNVCSWIQFLPVDSPHSAPVLSLESKQDRGHTLPPLRDEEPRTTRDGGAFLGGPAYCLLCLSLVFELTERWRYKRDTSKARPFLLWIIQLWWWKLHPGKRCCWRDGDGDRRPGFDLQLYHFLAVISIEPSWVLTMSPADKSWAAENSIWHSAVKAIC